MSEENRPDSRSLPTESDFVVVPEFSFLDQVHAWRNFGGLTLDEAKAKFAENPIYYQECFMWMGAPAFAYYFPVLDEYLRGVPESEEPEDDSEAWILARDIQFQFDERTIDRLRTIAPDVLALSEYVRDRIRRFGEDDERRRQVADAWTELSLHILTLADA